MVIVLGKCCKLRQDGQECDEYEYVYTVLHINCLKVSDFHLDYIFSTLSLKLLPITDTELKLMANAATIGLSSNPNKG